MVAPPSKLKVVISAAVITAALVFLTIMTALTPPQQPVVLYTENTPAAIHITQNGTITTPSAYNQTPPIERNGDKYTFTESISALIVVDKSNIVIDGGGFWVATAFHQGRGSPGYGLKLLGVSNVTVDNIQGELGVRLERAQNCTVTNSLGVGLYYSSGNVVSNCTGWALSHASSNTIVNCTSGALGMEYSESNYILYCTSTGPGPSIAIVDSSNNVFFGNIIENAWWLINMHGRCSNNYFVANTITISQRWNGNTLVGTNYFYHNNFLKWSWDQTAADNSVNVWSQDGRGNYYAGYASVDVNHNGIIDVPFVIDKNNVDNYPLMTPVNKEAEPIPTTHP